MTRLSVALLAVVLACLAGPAHADPTDGSTAGVDGVLYDDCVDQPYRYAVDVPADAESWGLATAAVGPDGQTADTDFVSATATSGTSSFSLCRPTDPFGRYTIVATFQWQDSGSTWQFSRLDDSHFTMRKPHTRTALSVSTRRPAYGQRVGYRISVWDERPAGYAPTAFAWVVLQRKVDGHWVRIRGSRTLTHATGRVTLRLTYRGHHRSTRVRAVTQRSDRYSRSTSAPVRLW